MLVSVSQVYFMHVSDDHPGLDVAIRRGKDNSLLHRWSIGGSFANRRNLPCRNSVDRLSRFRAQSEQPSKRPGTEPT